MSELKTVKEIKESEDYKPSVIIQLLDDAVVEIVDDSYEISGYCETCDYGAQYVREFEFKMLEGMVTIDYRSTWETPMNVSDMMLFLTNNVDAFAKMTKKEFFEVIENPNNILGE